MQIAGIIAEYNPFHNGHAYQIQQTKKELGCDYIIAIMSGNFSQRGTATIVDKFTRTKMALASGVDLVLELPVPFATASAEFFAKYAVSILNQLGIAHYISFGSECGDVQKLSDIARVLIQDQAHLSPMIQAYLREGLSFPRARMQALLDHLTHVYPSKADLQTILQAPNNILGIEYVKALMHLDSSIQPFSVQRLGSQYHDTHITGPLASATAIRHSIAVETSQYINCMPETTYAHLKSCVPPNMNDFSAFLHFKLMFSQEEDLYSLWDIPNDLIRTFKKHVQDYPTYETLVNRATSKTYTKATVQRALLRILLNITTSDMEPFLQSSTLPYTRVLGCRKDALSLLSHINRCSKIPLLTNVGKQYQQLSPLGQRLLDYELTATGLYAYLTHVSSDAHKDFTQPFICYDFS